MGNDRFQSDLICFFLSLFDQIKESENYITFVRAKQPRICLFYEPSNLVDSFTDSVRSFSNCLTDI